MFQHINNKKTVQAYNNSPEAYIEKTPRVYLPQHGPMLGWINAALELLSQDSRILEIGSATNRDAQYIRHYGFEVQCSDAADSFVDKMREQGEAAIKLDILNDAIPQGYGMIFANAVAPHFTHRDMHLALEKCWRALPPQGLLVFNVKRGCGEHWIDEKLRDKRYTLFWQPKSIVSFIESLKFKIAFIQSDAPGDLPNHHWINIIAQKP